MFGTPSTVENYEECPGTSGDESGHRPGSKMWGMMTPCLFMRMNDEGYYDVTEKMS